MHLSVFWPQLYIYDIYCGKITFFIFQYGKWNICQSIIQIYAIVLRSESLYPIFVLWGIIKEMKNVVPWLSIAEICIPAILRTHKPKQVMQM